MGKRDPEPPWRVALLARRRKLSENVTLHRRPPLTVGAMSYVEHHLLPNEVVAYKTTVHWKVYLWPAALTLLAFAPLFVVAISSRHRMLALLPAFASALLFGAAWMRRRFSEYAVTNKRVIVKIGILQTRSVELLLGKVEGITVTQGLGGRLLGYGQIVITGSGGTQEPFSGIQSPLDFRRAVQAATDARAGG
jgi:uncharacterized membrane protein YdbT with pleckstrin-like domain